MEFKDTYGASCSLQASSLIGNYENSWSHPGTSAVWLGIDKVEPIVMASQAASVGVDTKETTGWVPYPVPPQVQLNARMHLDREQVEGLIVRLQEWLDHAKAH